MTGIDIPAPTERIQFRPYRDSDLDEVVRMFGDPQARTFYPEMHGRTAASRWIEWNLENYRTLGFGLWVVEDLTGMFLGDCGVTLQEVEGEQVEEVGYHLLEEHRGKGLATEAGRTAVDYAFDIIGAESVCSIVDPENHASMAVASRLHPYRRSFISGKGKRGWLYWSEDRNS